MKVAFCAAEVVPFVKTGGLADVAGALPSALVRQGCEVDVFLPLYKGIRQAGLPFEDVCADVKRMVTENGMIMYFIDHARYFDRDGIYGNDDGDFQDNCQRFAYFNRKILETLLFLNRPVDVIHCHDWHTALIPVYLKDAFTEQAFFKNTKTVLTIHNLAFQGVFPLDQFASLELSEKWLSDNGLLFYEQINFLKAGLNAADQVTTVSQQYAREIQTKKFGCGLEKDIEKLKPAVIGIVNGLDETIWDPSVDPLIPVPFSEISFAEEKNLNKEHIQKQFRLDVDGERLLLGSVGRISHQKGMMLVMEALPDLMKLPVHFILQGVGEPEMENQLKAFSAAYTNQFVYFDQFDEPVAHRIYASSDFFLMPSLFEPCGLSQMIAMRYASLPLAAPTGGLIDTVEHGLNGCVMKEASARGLLESVKEAIDIYQDKDKYQDMQQAALKTHFSWGEAARKYKDLYSCLLSD